MRLTILLLLPALALPATARADALQFLRVDQTGFFTRGEVGASYGFEGARGLANMEGSGTAKYYGQLIHRFALAYGVADWLVIGAEQNVKQDGEDISVGVLAPEVRVAMGHSGVAGFSQARLRIHARRPGTVVVGLVTDRRVGVLTLAARAGYESTVAADSAERGLRYELGSSWTFARRWRAGAEAWGNSTWIATGRQGEHHVGPMLQVDLDAVNLGAGVGFGLRDRPGQREVDSVGLVRVGVRF